MTIREKLLILWLFAVVVVAFLISHCAGHLLPAISNAFASTLVYSEAAMKLLFGL